MTLGLDSGLKAIEVLLKVLPFMKTWTGERRREYFTTCIDPMFASFERVHEFYIDLILQTRDSVVTIDRDGKDLLGNLRDPLETRRHLTSTLDAFSRRRMEDEHVRDTLRRDAQLCLSRIPWREEQHFLVLICFYFLQKGGIHPSPDVLDREVKEVVARGGNTYWDTPSMRLYEELRKADSCLTAMSVLDEARDDLNQRYMNARLAYRGVQDHLILST